MPGLKPLPRLKSKGALRNWFDQNLMKGLSNKPALASKLRQQTDRFSRILARLPDSQEDLPPVVNRNQNPAWLAQIQQHAKTHADYLIEVQDLLSRDEDLTAKVMSQIKHFGAQVQQDAEQWDINQQTYAREFAAFDQKNQAHHQAYQDMRNDLGQMLETMRGQYNREFFIHEDMNDANREIFLRSAENAAMFKPTHHWWNSAVSSGTYFYDFRSHRFQLHIHCKPFDGKVKNVQVKMDSESFGKAPIDRSTAAAIAAKFREMYPPVERSAKKRAHVS